MEGCIIMTMNELSRIEVVNKILDKWLKNKEAAEILGLSKETDTAFVQTIQNGKAKWVDFRKT